MLSAATAPRRSDAPRALVAAVRGLEVFVFALLPATCAVLFATVLILKSHTLFDFRWMWEGGRDVLHGRSPYPVHLPTSAASSTFSPFVYPAPAAVLMVPFAILPWFVAALAWAGLSLASVFVTLRLLGVSDRRCYGAIFIWPAIWTAMANGSATLFLLVACAALWKFRDRPVVAGSLLALVVVLKLFLWPLAVWLIATRRIRATLVSAVASFVAVIGGWALLDFAGLASYPKLLDRLTALVAAESYSPYAFVRSLGASPGVATLAMLFLGGGLLLAVVAVARRRGHGDRLSFMLAIAASLVLTPIVWPHYFALLAIVVALASRQLDAGWLLPIAAWLVATAWSGGSPLKIGFCLAIYGTTVAWSLRRAAGAEVLRPAASLPT
jgi:alpha-1,2-mannosyltransferase